MPAPFYTSNPAEFNLLEGLYIWEQNPPGFIQGVDLGVVGIAGECVRGPVDTAIEITTEARFKEVFGGRDYGAGGALAGEVWAALLGKKYGKVIVVRAAATAGVASSFNAESAAGGGGTEIVKIEATSKGTWGNNVGWKVEAASDADANKFNLRLRYLGETKLYENLNLFSTNDNSLTVLGDDVGNWVKLTKLANGRPVNSAASTDGADVDGYVLLGQVVALFTSVAGTNGAIADADYTGAGRAMSVLDAYRGIGVQIVANRQTAAIKAAIKTAAAAATDRLYLMWSGTHADSVATVVADVASYRSDRVVYCYNSPYTLDPETATLIQVPPHAWLAAFLSQVDVDVDPLDSANKKLLAGISKLTSEALVRADYKSLRAAGICALEKDDGFTFVSGVTTDLTSGKTRITRRRSTDELQLAGGKRLKDFVAKKATDENKAQILGESVAYLDGLKKAQRIVKDFAVSFEQTPVQEATGLAFVVWRVRLIGHLLDIVLKTQIGTTVEIPAAA